MSNAYQPVQCDFHDTLEDAAVRRRTCRVRYRDERGRPHDVTTTLQDVFARDGAEYARLGTGVLVRLDRLDRVEPVDAPSPGAAEGGAP